MNSGSPWLRQPTARLASATSYLYEPFIRQGSRCVHNVVARGAEDSGPEREARPAVEATVVRRCR